MNICSKKIIIAAALLGCYASLPSYASEKAETGLVLSAEGGYAKANADFTESEIKKGNLYYGANLGFDFALSDYLAIGPEVGVFYGKSLSTYDESNGSQEVSNLIVPVLAKIKLVTPIGFNIFAKGGVSYVRPSASKSGDTTLVNWDNSWNFTAAGGIGYQIKNLNIYAQYLHIFGKNEVSVDGTKGTGYASDIDAITLGLSYTFS